MNKDFLLENENINKHDDICMEYMGHMSQIMIREMLLSIKIESDYRKINATILNKINTTFIELTQNILKYSKNTNDGYRKYLDTVTLFQNDGVCYLVAKNVISKNSKEKITSRIDEIQTYDKAQINAKYFELCKSGEKSHVHGGGVGLYQIAKKSDGIRYTTNKISDNKYYLSMMVAININ